mgnify:CR=1 FL=1
MIGKYDSYIDNSNELIIDICKDHVFGYTCMLLNLPESLMNFWTEDICWFVSS